MTILIGVIIAILVAALLIWAVDLLPVDARLSQILKVVIILITVLLIVRHVGLI